MSSPCLPVPNRKRKRDPRRETGTPTGFDDIGEMDAAEYLARVVSQAKSLPDVFTANDSHGGDQASLTVPSRIRNHVPIDGSAASLSYLVSGRASLSLPPTEEHLPQNATWVETTIDNFEKLRSYLDTCKSQGIGGKKTNRIPFPPMKDRAGWHLFCLGKDESDGNVDSYFGDDYAGDNDNEDNEINPDTSQNAKQGNYKAISDWKTTVPKEGHEPSVRLVAQMDQVLVRRVLSHLSHYLDRGWVLTPQRSAWLYALLARLEKPIHRDDAAVLFSLLKVLTNTRKAADVGNRGSLARLNVLIALISIFFEQGERGVMNYNSSNIGT